MTQFKWLLVVLGLGIATTHKESQPVGGVDSPVHTLAASTGFLRTSSSKVGGAVQSMLSIQGSLDSMKDDLAGEYSLWQQKQMTYTAERARLQNEIAVLEAKLVQQGQFQEAKARLLSELTFHQGQTANAHKIAEQARVERAVARQKLNVDIQAVERKINEATEEKKIRVLNETHKSNQLTDQNRHTQKRIFNLNQQVTKLQDALVKQNVDTKKTQDAVLQEIRKTQEAIHALQGKMVAQAQKRAEQQRLALQVTEVVKQRETLSEVQQLHRGAQTS